MATYTTQSPTVAAARLAANLLLSTGASLLGFIQAFTGAVYQSIAAKLSQDLTSYDFLTVAEIADVRSGAPVGDYTAKLQALFDVTDRRVIVKPGIYPTSGALTRGTLAARALPIVMEPGALIRPSGSAYTALSVFPSFFSYGWAITINTGASTLAGRPVLNGLFIDNMAGSATSLLRVTGCNGYGVKIDRCWDSHHAQISVELCGNATNYAYSMNTNGSDTCNETHVARLQVEQSDRQAIYIAPTTLNVRFSVIHSERTYADTAFVTWELGGACVYGSLRLTTSKDAALDGVGVAQLRGGNSVFEYLRMEQGAGATITAEVRANAGTVMIRRLSVPTLRTGAGHNDRLIIEEAVVSGTATIPTVADLFWKNGSAATLALTGSLSPTLANALRVVFRNVTLSAITCSGNPVATFENCVLTSIGTGGAFYYRGCSMADGFTISTQTWEAHDCQFLGTLNVNFASGGKGKLQNCDIVTNLAAPNGTNALTSINTKVGGTVTATLNAAPGAGTYLVGERSYRVTPVVGQPKSWVVTAAGTPGTWTSEGNL